MSHETDLAELQAARAAAIEKFGVAADLIASALREYAVVWERAVRASHAAATPVLPNRPSLGGRLQPLTSPHHPRHVKRALGRVLRASGFDPTDYAMRQGARQRGR
jgi:hypothetical protein